MFRRLPCGLPKDPVFPDDLESLDYYINHKDEIRNIKNLKAYFKFFLTKNDRYNCVQREAMNGAIRKIVQFRLEQDFGLSQVLLPLGAKENEPHLPIYTSSNIAATKRVIILFYEHNQDLGIFAHRIIGGQGGINEGSAINLVKYVQSVPASKDDESSPGIILANMGQLRWWRRGKKAVTQVSWFSLPQKSAVDQPYVFDEIKNTIPGNRTTEEHVKYMFDRVIEELVSPGASINVIGVSNGAYEVSKFLDNSLNWEKWQHRITAFAAVATYFHAHELKNEKFAEWYKQRGRSYALSDEPAGVFLAGPGGSKRVMAHGCPMFSLGEPYYTESMLPKGYMTIIDWFQEVAVDPKYVNPQFYRLDDESDNDNVEEIDTTPGWERIDEVRATPTESSTST